MKQQEEIYMSKVVIFKLLKIKNKEKNLNTDREKV